MKYRFLATRTFWRGVFYKQNPFDPRLHAHKIHKLSARYGRLIYAAEIEADLGVLFYIEANTVVTVDIGSHDCIADNLCALV